jgi:hypothetical protein
VLPPSQCRYIELQEPALGSLRISASGLADFAHAVEVRLVCKVGSVPGSCAVLLNSLTYHGLQAEAGLALAAVPEEAARVAAAQQTKKAAETANAALGTPVKQAAGGKALETALGLTLSTQINPDLALGNGVRLHAATDEQQYKATSLTVECYNRRTQLLVLGGAVFGMHPLITGIGPHPRSLLRVEIPSAVSGTFTGLLPGADTLTQFPKAHRRARLICMLSCMWVEGAPTLPTGTKPVLVTRPCFPMPPWQVEDDAIAFHSACLTLAAQQPAAAPQMQDEEEAADADAAVDALMGGLLRNLPNLAARAAAAAGAPPPRLPAAAGVAWQHNSN